jgi:hypothetical protein
MSLALNKMTRNHQASVSFLDFLLLPYFQKRATKQTFMCVSYLLISYSVRIQKIILSHAKRTVKKNPFCFNLGCCYFYNLLTEKQIIIWGQSVIRLKVSNKLGEETQGGKEKQ